MMARGIVCVLPVRLPAKIMVAPNSEIARAQAKASPATMDGPASGAVSRKNVAQGAEPRVWEISSYSLDTI